VQSVISKTWFRVAAGIVLAVAIFITLNWPIVALTSAVASSERRPALLNDASWNEPASAARFYDRFGANASDRKLVSWLEENEFEIDQEARNAKKQIYSFPCNEFINVTWSLSEAGSIAGLNAIISEGRCL